MAHLRKSLSATTECVVDLWAKPAVGGSCHTLAGNQFPVEPGRSDPAHRKRGYVRCKRLPFETQTI
jgi:hypothetical protein